MARNRNKDTAVAEANEAIDEMLDVEEEDAEETEETHQPITPAQIAEATGADPKAIRGWLRANYPRVPEMKGKSWDIPADAADAAIKRFTPPVEGDEDAEELEDVVSDSE